MSYLKATQKGFIDSEATIEEATQEGLKAYKAAKVEISDLLAKQYAKLAEVTPDKYYNEMLKDDRLKKLNAEITALYKSASTAAGKKIVSGLQAGFTENYYKQQYTSLWLAEAIPTPISPDLVKFATTGNVKLWAAIQKAYGNATLYSPQAGTLAELLTKNYTAELDKILQAVQNGFIAGKSYTTQAGTISGIIGKYVKKTDKATGAMYNALRIARTEGQRVLNAASLANAQQLANQGFKTEKEWLASMDSITRTSHRGLDGQRKAIDKNFISPSSGAKGQAPGQMSKAGENINCRCTTMTIIDGEGPETRAAINPVSGEREVIDYASYSEWIKQF